MKYTHLILLCAACSGAWAQRPLSPGKLPRTSWGKPDLQGVWAHGTVTPLERPPEFAGKAFLTPEEATAFEKKTVQQNDSDRRENTTAEADVARAYNNAWYDRGTKLSEGRPTSLIVDPPDGLVPALTPEAQKRIDGQRAYVAAHPADNPEDRSLMERCLTRGVPILPGPYNNNIQIVQTQDTVAILNEPVHDARMIHIDTPSEHRAHMPDSVRQWLGDPRAHWEGDTLVIDSTNFSTKSNLRGSNAGLHLIERIQRAGPNSLRYEFTVEDPSTFTKKWTGVVPMTKSDLPIYEYACHEGNYAMSGMLGGARAAETEAAKKK